MKKTAAAAPMVYHDRGFRVLLRNIIKSRAIYLILLPGLAWYTIFAYGPMAGLTLAFKTYKARLGIFGSPWVGFENYTYVFRDPAFFDSIWRTLSINFGRLLIEFPFTIFLALIFNEVRLGRSKKTLQVIMTFPHFLSWVIVASVMINTFSLNGFVNAFLKLLGFEPYSFMGSSAAFQPLVYVTSIWKDAGWNAIIYMAAIAGIDTEQYEAASIDGASRFQRAMHITLPSIAPTITVMLILSVGNMMSAGFDQVFNLSNAATAKAAETLDMYIYRVTFKAATDFSYSTALSLFRSVVNLILLLTTNFLSKRISGSGLIG